MNEQEQFEAWVNSLNPGWLLDKTKNDGDYAFPRAYAGWQAWQAAIATQQARIQAALEVYAGMEGFIPETAAEGYCLRIIEQMNAALLEQEGGDEQTL